MNKYTREHDIINNKLVNFDSLKKKKKDLYLELEIEEKDIEWFKKKIHDCKENIGDEKFIKNIFNELCQKYIQDYNPPKKDQELKSEFENQKANMQKNSKELAEQMKFMKKEHSKEIKENRQKNTQLIGKIEELKKNIKISKHEKSKAAADSKHLSSIAAIGAQKNLKFLEEVEYASQEEKIERLQAEFDKRKKKLEEKTEEFEIFQSRFENQTIDEGDDELEDDEEDY